MSEKQVDTFQNDLSGSETPSPDDDSHVQWTPEEERKLVRKYEHLHYLQFLTTFAKDTKILQG